MKDYKNHHIHQCYECEKQWECDDTKACRGADYAVCSECEQKGLWDFSPGEVIDADEKGNIVLDDGITTFNPERAKKFLEEKRKSKTAYPNPLRHEP